MDMICIKQNLDMFILFNRKLNNIIRIMLYFVQQIGKCYNNHRFLLGEKKI